MRKSHGALHDTKNSMAINTVEFSRNDLEIHTTATSLIEPGKFKVEIDTTRLGCGSSKYLLNGALSQNSQITVLINIATAVADA